VGQVFLPKVKSELMYGYPDAGIAYIANGYAGEVIRIQKFLPKDHLEFQNQEGSNFVPITVLSPTPRKIAEGNELFSESNYSMLVYAAIGLSIIVVTLIIWLGFSLRKNR